MDNDRREELVQLWGDETSEEWARDWREDLTAEERDFVAGLDESYRRGTRQLCACIVIRDKLRRRYGPGQIRELRSLGDCCRLELRDGRTYLVSLGRRGELKLQEIEGEG